MFKSFSDGVAAATSDLAEGWVESAEFDFIVNQLRVMVGASDAYLAGYLSVIFSENNC